MSTKFTGLNPFQIAALDYMFKARNGQSCIIQAGTGKGKSLIPLAACVMLRKHGHPHKTVIFAPKQAVYSFERSNFWGLRLVAVHDKPECRNLTDMMSRPHDVLVVASHLLPDLHPALFKSYARMYVDEIHVLRNHASAVSRAAFAVVTQTQMPVVGLTATPVYSKITNLFGIFRVLDRTLFPSYEAFCERFLVRIGPFKNVQGYKNVEVLKKITAPYVFEDMSQSIQVHYHTVTTQLTPAEQASYDRAAKGAHGLTFYCHFVSQNGKQSTLIRDQTVRTDQGTLLCDLQNSDTFTFEGKAWYYLDKRIAEPSEYTAYTISELQKRLIANPAKFDTLCKLIDSHGTGLIVFCKRLDTLEYITAALSKRYGSRVVPVRTGALQAETIRLLTADSIAVITISGTFSWDFPHNKIVIYEMPSVVGLYTQLQGRITRFISTHTDADIVHIIVRDTIDEYLYRYLDHFRHNRNQSLAAIRNQYLWRRVGRKKVANG